MGWDLVAYIDIEQTEVEEYILQEGLDKTDWKNGDTIAEFFRNKLGLDKQLYYLYYNWNQECKLHELFMMHRVTYVRDDERLSNRRYHLEYKKRTGRDFPSCLNGFLNYIRDPEDALQVAAALRNVFGQEEDDKGYAYLANWLEETAKICNMYELSY